MHQMFGSYHGVVIICLTILLIGGNEFGVESYVNSPHALPLSRQMLYLEELTSDVVSAQPGALSTIQIAASHKLLHAWSHTDQTKTDDRCEAARKVEALIKRLVDERMAGNSEATIDTADYNCVLEGWARCGNEASAMRAESVLEAMQEHGPSPNLDSYKACLMAWWNCRRLPYAPHRAQRILDKLIASSKRTDVPSGSPFPDSDCFDICLLLHSANGNARNAERLLGAMAQFSQPTISSFNAVLRAWFNSKDHQEAADRMETILSFMESQPHLQTDRSSYRTVMNTFLHLPDTKEALQRSEDLLKHVLSLEKEENSEGLDRIMFNGPMGLCAKVKDSQGYRRARWILDQEIKRQTPDVVGLTSVIGACAASDDPQAVEVAVSTYRMFQKLDVKPNFVTFATMLKVCGKINGDVDGYKTKWIRRVFQDATTSGHFNGMVRSRLKQAASRSLYNNLLGGYAGSKSPAEWYRNVDQQPNDKDLRKRGEV